MTSANSGCFRFLKIIQLLFALTVLITEMVKLNAFNSTLQPFKSYLPQSDQIPSNEYYYDREPMGGSVSAWVLAVIIVTILSLVFYLCRFSHYWTQGPSFWFELFFIAIWFSGAMANLKPIFLNLDIETCAQASQLNSGPFSNNNFDSGPFGSFGSSELNLLSTMCSAYIASEVFLWINFILFVVTAIIAHDAPKEMAGGTADMEIAGDRQETGEVPRVVVSY